MNFFLLIATISLIIQLIVLALLLIGYGFKRRLRYRMHGMFMLSAVVLHLAAIFAIMVPSFIAIMTENPTTLITTFAPFHATAGTITAILGVWIVGGWRLRQSTNYCAPKKKFMLATIILWLATIAFGIIFYFILNWTFIFG